MAPVLADADRLAKNILGVFPELRMHATYIVAIRDDEGRLRAMRANTAIERGEIGRPGLIAALREAADALEQAESHYNERRMRVNAAGVEEPLDI